MVRRCRVYYVTGASYWWLTLCRFLVPALLSSFFNQCVVMLVLWAPSSIAAHFAFCFTSCVVMLALWSLPTAPFCFLFY